MGDVATVIDRSVDIEKRSFHNPLSYLASLGSENELRECPPSVPPYSMKANADA